MKFDISVFFDVSRIFKLLYAKTFSITSRSILLGMKNISNKSCSENRRKDVSKIRSDYILCSVTRFLKSCRIWVNEEKYYTAGWTIDENIICRMHFVCWLTKTTDTHTQNVLHALFVHEWIGENYTMRSIIICTLHTLSCA
jgi:hypothetical protein